MKFYKNVFLEKNYLLTKEYKNNKDVYTKVKYEPSIFMEDNEGFYYEPITKHKLKKHTFTSIYDYYAYVKKYQDISNYKLYGNKDFRSCWLADNYAETKFDVEKIKPCLNIINIDIEVVSQDGFPKPEDALAPLCLITLGNLYKGDDEKFITLGLRPIQDKSIEEDTTYIFCKDEKELLKKFIEVWQSLNVDIVTGWNVGDFDITYLINRMKRVFKFSTAYKNLWLGLSSWGVIKEHTKSQYVFGTKQITKYYTIAGVTIFDYLSIYKKYIFKNRPSYSLDSISQIELGEGKIEYSNDYLSLNNLYEENYDLYVKYNIQDVALVNKLDKKLKFMDMVLHLIYDAVMPYDNVLLPTKMWEQIIFKYYKKHKLVMLYNTYTNNEDSEYIGAYVKEVIPNKYLWIMAFDIDSLYPNIIVQQNISFETYCPQEYSKIINPNDIENESEEEIKTRNEYLKEKNVTFTLNSVEYTKETCGILPTLIKEIYKERQRCKRLSKDNNKKYIDTKLEKYKIRADYYSSYQHIKKIQLNSLYGALGCIWFKFFNIKLAESVTSTGQYIIKSIENSVNNYIKTILNKEKEDYIVAMDTDSIYVRFDEFIEKLKLKGKEKIINFLDKKVSPEIQKIIVQDAKKIAIKLNSYENRIVMKREVIADKGIFLAKKRYILSIVDDEGIREKKLKMVGISAISSWIPPFCKERIINVIKEYFLSEEDNIDNIKIDLKKYIKETKTIFKKLPHNEISRAKSINHLKKYSDKNTIYRKGSGFHIKGALFYNHLIDYYKIENKYDKIKEGDKIKMVYLKPNIWNMNVIAFHSKIPKEFELINYIDYDTEFEKTFVEQIDMIGKVLGLDLIMMNKHLNKNQLTFLKR